MRHRCTAVGNPGGRGKEFFGFWLNSFEGLKGVLGVLKKSKGISFSCFIAILCDNDLNPPLTLYTRHGQSAARGPYAALQTFFAALELKIFDSPLTII